jgi:2-polyprenyl-3-methyl-5-hydroxy-6-metoxy-1,4-benzoquinol methylase
MKQKAIVSLLWSTQLEALQQFLMMHEPMVVIAHAGSASTELPQIVAGTGGTLVWLDSLLDLQSTHRIGTEIEQLKGGFEDYFRSLRDPNGPSPDTPNPLATLITESLTNDLPLAVRLIESLKIAADQYEIALFVTSEDVTGLGKVATAWAKSRGIPSLHVAHSIALVDPYTAHDQLLADKLAVYGRRGMEGYLDLGYPEERMVLTGNPAWDCYVGLRGKKSTCREFLNEKYRFKADLPVVVFGTTYSANLSAHCNEHVFTDSLTVFIAACETLKRKGLKFNAVIKDRAANQDFGAQRCNQILAELQATGGDYFYSVDDTRVFAAAADVLVAVDSNYLVEGMLAHTPVINLLTSTGMLAGPCFESEAGVMEVESSELTDAIQAVLTNESVREGMLWMTRQRASYYNHCDGDGGASLRVAQTMAGMALQLPRRIQRFVWQQYLDVETADVADIYHTTGRPQLAAMYTNKPAVILDVGCAAGSNAALIKQRFPGSRAWGIEMNHAAAQLAQSKLDRVLVGKFEDFDLEQEGIAKGTLDAVLLADVLEHMYNPWDVMVKLRSYISPTGQLVLSIPNVRNLWLMDQLSKGNWTYEGQGLLDITHIRFFTLKEILKFCSETGYRVVRVESSIDGRLQPFWNLHQSATAPFDINTDRLTLKGVTRDELLELCAVQFYLLLEKDTAAPVVA